MRRINFADKRIAIEFETAAGFNLQLHGKARKLISLIYTNSIIVFLNIQKIVECSEVLSSSGTIEP